VKLAHIYIILIRMLYIYLPLMNCGQSIVNYHSGITHSAISLLLPVDSRILALIFMFIMTRQSISEL